MINSNRTILIVAIFTVVLTIGIGSYIVLGDNKDDYTIVNIDYNKLDEVVPETLSKMPEIEIYIKDIQEDVDTNRNVINSSSVEDLFDSNKRLFRMKVENALTGQKDQKNINELSIEYTDNYLNALVIAESIYNVTISQDEITSYIDSNVSSVFSKEKELYANSLGLKLEELDYIFDRDIYAMDTLWEKLIPVLMEKYPQNEDEKDNNYLERIKMEFYSN